MLWEWMRDNNQAKGATAGSGRIVVFRHEGRDGFGQFCSERGPLRRRSKAHLDVEVTFQLLCPRHRQVGIRAAEGPEQIDGGSHRQSVGAASAQVQRLEAQPHAALRIAQPQRIADDLA